MQGEAPVRAGDVLAQKYRVDRVLGVGGMGVVVSATHLQLDQRVALKFMLPTAFANPEALGRFQREARAAVKLKSEHVARVLDTGTFDDGSPYIVMEYLEGTDLAAEIERAGSLPLQVVAEYIVQACEAIAEAHSLGIVHRDLKPGNLFLTRRAEGSPLVKVLDFGISKTNALTDSGNLQMTKTASMLGSPLYMSPEQMKSSKTVDARTDVWSIGVILYEMLGGRVPFNSDSLGGLMAAVMTEPPAPLELARPDLPRDVCLLVNRCLEKDPARRVANVAEIARGLAPYCPQRVHAIVERVSALVGATSPPAGGASGPQVKTMAATLPHGGVVGAISGPTGPSPSWGSTGAPVVKRSSMALVWVLAGVVVVGGVVALGLVVMQKRAHAVADTPPGSAVFAAAPPVAASTSAPTASVVLSPVEPPGAATASVAPPPPSSSHASVAPPGRVPPRPAPSVTTKPAPTAAPNVTPTATPPAPQKPGILDTSN